MYAYVVIATIFGE